MSRERLETIVLQWLVELVFDGRIELFQGGWIVGQIFNDGVAAVPPADEINLAASVAAKRSCLCFCGIDRLGADRAGDGLDHGPNLSLLFLLAGIIFFFEVIEVFHGFVVE